jgi:hypothetical protein
VQLKVFWATLLRRWYLLVIALTCTVVATVIVINKVGPTYEANGAVLLFPPTTTVQRGTIPKTEGNPYLELGGLNQMRDIVLRAVMSKNTHEALCQQQGDAGYEAMRRQLCDSHPTVSYEATQDYTNNAPMILITVEAKSPAIAVMGLDAVMNIVPKTVNELQAGLNLRPSATISSRPLTADKTPDVVLKQQIRAGIVAGAGTFTLSLLIIGLFDGLMAVRRARRRAVGHDESVFEEPGGAEAGAEVALGVKSSTKVPVAEATADAGVLRKEARAAEAAAAEVVVAAAPGGAQTVAADAVPAAEMPAAEASAAKMAAEDEVPAVEVAAEDEVPAVEVAAEDEVPVSAEPADEWPVAEWAVQDEPGLDEPSPVRRLTEKSRSRDRDTTMAASA